MKTILYLMIFFSFNLLASPDYQDTECYKKFVSHSTKVKKNHDFKVKRFLEARMNPTLISQFFEYPETPKDFEIGIVKSLKVKSYEKYYTWPKELKDLHKLVNNKQIEEYSVTNIQDALKAGFKEDKFCGFLKGFGAVKRFVKSYLEKNHDSIKQKVSAHDNSHRSEQNKESESKKNKKSVNEVNHY